MNKLLTFLRSFQNSPTFANLAIHAWCSAFLLFVALMRFPSHAVLCTALAIAISAAKEFWFDMRYEIPPQPFWNAVQDFLGYEIGILVAVLTAKLLF